ncbi:MFS transporter [Lentzea tibetensis]|uniref:MFS transporter n=1 Tax=Lentzea tibetensis TaxID=2591470 RepID=A0A563ESE4_9PSEU|nr:MFS transporter [Lentzea tibetensis]TWP50441.1 MFS transporter [Lentzea tibetensis]
MSQAELREGPSRQRMFWLGRGVSFFGSEFSTLGIPLYCVVVLGAGPAEMGLLVACAGLPALLGPFVAGPVVDLFDRRLLLVVTDLVRCAALLAVLPLHWAGALNLTVLLGLQFVLGAASTLYDTALFAFLPSYFPPHQLAMANGRSSALHSAASLAGPSLAGALVQAVGAVAAIVVDGISFLVSALTIGHSTAEVPTTKRSSGGYKAFLADGFRALRDTPPVLLLGFSSCLFNLAAGASQAVIVYFAIKVLGFPALLLGLATSAGLVGGLVTGLVARKLSDALGLRTMLSGGILLASVAEFAIAVAPADKAVAFAVIATAQCVATSGAVAYMTANATLRQHLVPEHVRGRVFATLRLLTRGVMPLGAAAGGLLAAGTSPRFAIAAAGMGQLVAALWLFTRRRVLPDRL